MIKITFSENLIFTGDFNKNQVIERLRCGYAVLNIYLVCNNESKNNRSVLEIYHSPEVFKPMVDHTKLKVLAVCEGKDNSKKACMNILFKKYKNDTDNKEGGFNCQNGYLR